MGKLHALLAVESNLVNSAVSLMKEATDTFRGKPDRFLGQVRHVSYYDDERQHENVNERKEVVTTVDAKLDFVLPHVSAMYDALLQKESGNQTAKADLVVNGVTLAKDVPATFLLGMETRLKVLREVFLTIPTLDPNHVWTADTNLGNGIFRSPVLSSQKTEKRPDVLVLYEATDKHPAQVKEIIRDMNVARIDTTHFSGMWSTAKKAEVLGRIDALLIGVKEARMAANDADVPAVTIGSKLVKFILG